MFRCFFMGPDGHFVGATNVEGAEEDVAIEEARRVLQAGEVRQAIAFEVWRAAELVFSSATRPPLRLWPGASASSRPRSGAFRPAATEAGEARNPGSDRAG
jgi:hypothetical protein